MLNGDRDIQNVLKSPKGQTFLLLPVDHIQLWGLHPFFNIYLLPIYLIIYLYVFLY